MRVLIVEDDHVLRRALGVALRSNGLKVIEAQDAAAARAAVNRGRFEVLLLDLGLPDEDGLNLLPDLRAAHGGGIIVVSARRDQSDKVIALDRGADDYVTKPFGLPELLARIRAVNRRAGAAEKVRTSHLSIDLARCCVHRDTAEGAEVVALSPTEWAVLELLARANGAPVSPEELLAGVWGQRGGEHRNYVRVYINTLRRKLEPDPGNPCCVLSATGRGYWLAVASAQDPSPAQK